MDCNDVRKKMSAYLDDELSFKDRELVERHLDMCPSCADEKKSLLLISSLMDEIAAEDVSPFFAERIIAGLKADNDKSYKLRFLRPALVCLGIILVLFAGIFEFHKWAGSEKAEYAYLRDFDDFPPDSFSHIFMSSLRRETK
jgi:predicted anti-sigma-YlaC factor YlaD